MINNDWHRVNLIEANGNLTPFAEATSKIVCVGRNYVEHAKELNNPVPSSPILFIKPNSCLVDLASGIKLPDIDSSCHHELEVAILVGVKATAIDEQQVESIIAGVGLGLDLTLRDIQHQLKAKGHPWEKAKCFDGACPMSPFLPYNQSINLDCIDFKLIKNGEVAQHGITNQMVFSIRALIAEVTHHFTLYPGDIILTGTPAGVAELMPGDNLELHLNQQQWQTSVLTS
ncbi:fumarylacetoacetate hydrolase family protein [Aliikangiella sp. IMCC44359]|uniref:fumarylacetoacetate hydrolase family protein n=1 Tax=Aliikangiella sp. IMCC44359 TaxID=3459125 RepID=UPI00403ABC9D